MARSLPLTVAAAALVMLAVACGDDDSAGTGGAGGTGGGGSTSTTTSTTTTTTSTGGEGGSGGGGGGGGGAACVEPDAPDGVLTIRFRNELDRDVYLPLGCGDVPPVTIELPDGDVRIDPESADACQFVCERLLEGTAPTGCSDCGPGGSMVIPTGGTVDHDWDRRVYRTATIPPACTGLDTAHDCALAERLEDGIFPASVVACDGEPSGFCDGEEIPATAQLDLDADVVELVFGP